MPVISKTAFGCPTGQLEILDTALGETMRILIIGWRGSEQHFLKGFSALPGKAPLVEIVGISERGTVELPLTSHRLGLMRLVSTYMREDSAGISRMTIWNGFSRPLSGDGRAEG
jgi:hypothetical protein